MTIGAGRLRDAFRGALLGTFVGDALGAPVEGWSASRIRRRMGEVREMIDVRRGRGTYTDDTEMMILLAESLLEPDGFSAEGFSRRLAEKCDFSRGYGRGTTDVLRRLRAGEPWDVAAEKIFPFGSFGNGAAIRVAPVALLFHHDTSELVHVAEDSAVVTHAHPLGVAGAVVQARQIALALQLRDEPFDFRTGPGDNLPARLAVELRVETRSEEFRQKLRAVEECLDDRADPGTVRARLGSNSTALGSVPTALFAFLSHPESFEEAVVYAVNLGGDTDSVAAMTGAIAGAFHGAAAIPARWRSALEEGERGATYVEALAGRLLEKHVALRTPVRNF